MRKKIKLLALVFLLNSINFSVFAQIISSKSLLKGVSFNNNGAVTFNIDTVAPGRVFTIFSDGAFSFEPEPSHWFRSPGPQSAEIYRLKPYDPNIPRQIVQVNAPSTNTGNSTSNTEMSGNIGLFTSWNITKKSEAYLIIAFKHAAGFEEGCIKLKYNTSQITVNDSGIKTYNSVYEQSQPVKLLGYNKELKFSYSSLSSGETRHIYVPVTAVIGAGKQVKVEVSYQSQCNSSISTLEDIITVRGYPHDPNSKIVNKTCIPEKKAQLLKYEVEFYNEGDAETPNVCVKIPIAKELDETTIKVTGFEPQYKDRIVTSRDPNPDTKTKADYPYILKVDFMGINLPGTRQIKNLYTNQFYSYDEASVSFKYEGLTHAGLVHGDKIKSRAGIKFQGQAVFYTNYAETKVSRYFNNGCVPPEEETCDPCCGDSKEINFIIGILLLILLVLLLMLLILKRTCFKSGAKHLKAK